MQKLTLLVGFPQRVCDTERHRRRKCEEGDEEGARGRRTRGVWSDSLFTWWAVSTVGPVCDLGPRCRCYEPFLIISGEGYGWRRSGAWRGGHSADAGTDANSCAG